jgi:hypothetical protein
MALSSTTVVLVAALVLVAVVVWTLWRNPQLPGNVSLGSLAGVLLVVLGGIVAMALLLRESGPLHGQVWYPTGNVVAMVAIMGALGGVLAAHTQGDRGLVWPYRHAGDTPRYEFGILGDILLGVAGGIVVFVTVPGDPAAVITERATEMLRFLALPVIGGFGARTLLQKAVDARVGALEEETEKLKRDRQAKQAGDEARKQVQEYLAATGERTLDQAALAALFREADESALLDIFEQVKNFRQSREDKSNFADLGRAIPVLEALRGTRGPKDHLIDAQIAFIIAKKEPKASSGEVIAALDKAIASAASAGGKRDAVLHLLRLIAIGTASPPDPALEKTAIADAEIAKAAGLRPKDAPDLAAVNAYLARHGPQDAAGQPAIQL